MADRDAAVVERLEVDCEAEGRADLVVSSVALADISGLVVVDQDARSWRSTSKQIPARCVSSGFFSSGSTAALYGATSGVKPQHHSGVWLCR